MSNPTSNLAAALQDRYRLDRELGQGGMATVYLARDLKHDRDVALKVLRPELAAVLGAERFLREIQLTAKLQHPHIVTLIDSGDAGGSLYYVLPYIEGESLRQRLDREGQLPLDEVLRITRAVAGALQYAHDQGVIHRDIKPENILLSRGEPVVADFGIALAVASAGRERLTETGLSLGTPAYMSPEQASAEQRLDARSDQYSLACVVYEMLAGEPPYTGSTAQAIIAKRLSEPVPKLGTLRQVPQGVEAAVTRALAKRPADRFGSVAEFTAALERPAAPAKRFMNRRMAALMGGIAVLGVIALGASLFRPAPPPRSMVTRQLTFVGSAKWPSLSPDGKWAAFRMGDSLMVQELSGSRPLFVAPAHGRCAESHWSPDGRTLLYCDGDTLDSWLASVPYLGGEPHRILNRGRGAHSYMPDGQHLVYNQGPLDSILIADAQTGEVVRRLSVAPESYTALRVPVSPNGRWIAFGGELGGIPFLGVISTDGTVRRRLVDWVDRGTLQWAPHSDAIYFFQRVLGGADLMKVRIDPGTGERRSDPVRIISHAQFTEFSVGSDGRTLLYQQESPSSQVWTMTIAGPAGKATVQPRQLTGGTASFSNPSISPDGRWVVYAQDQATLRSLFVIPYEGGSPHLIAPTRSDYLTPAWAPDSRRLAFLPADSSVGGVSIVDIEEARPRGHGISPVGRYFGTLAWAPDGRALLFPSDNPRQYVLLDVEHDREGVFSPPKPIGWLHSPAFSPDGREVIVQVFDGAFHESLWRVSVATGEWSALTGVGWRGAPLLWSRQGWVYLLRGLNEIWRVRLDNQHAELYARLPKDCVSGPEQTSLDESATRVVCTVRESKPDIWVATDFDPEVR